MPPQVVDTMIWLFGVSNMYCPSRLSMLIIHPVIEDCGAMPDLEDREGEVSFILSERLQVMLIFRKLDGLVQGGLEWPHVDCKLPCAREG